jgi:rubrerythrin
MERINMSLTFNAEEILEMAVQIERNGIKFYKKAAGILPDKKTKKFLLDLADMEAEHEKTFTEMKNQLTEREKEPAVYDPDDQGALYLHATADGHVFNPKADIDKQLTGKETVEQVFNKAIQAEKDSIVFYLGLREFVSQKAGKEKVEKVIKEEQSHIVILNNHLKLYQ